MTVREAYLTLVKLILALLVAEFDVVQVYRHAKELRKEEAVAKDLACLLNVMPSFSSSAPSYPGPSYSMMPGGGGPTIMISPPATQHPTSYVDFPRHEQQQQLCGSFMSPPIYYNTPSYLSFNPPR